MRAKNSTPRLPKFFFFFFFLNGGGDNNDNNNDKNDDSTKTNGGLKFKFRYRCLKILTPKIPKNFNITFLLI